MVIEEPVEVALSDGTAKGFLYRSDSGDPNPGVVFYTDIFGIRDANKEMARRVAELGYTVLLPNVFFRVGEPPMFDFEPEFGTPKTMERLGELFGAVLPDQMLSDGKTYVEFLLANDASSGDAVGVVGYCFTGAMSLRTAAACGDQVAAAASFHGARLYTDDDSSPHLALPDVTARLYFGHAVEDGSMPPEAIEALGEALEAWGGEYESEVYEGAHHGWTVPGREVYNEPQAEVAFGKLSDLFAATLQ